jgi:hypothetical protein
MDYRMLKFKKNKIAVFAALLILSGVWLYNLYHIDGGVSKEPPLTASEKQSIIQQSITDKDFLRLFQQAPRIGSQENGPGNYMINDAVSSYVSVCCHDKESLIQLLEKNGFTVKSGKAESFAKDSWNKTVYDEKIYGEKNMITPAIIVGRYYRVHFFLRNGRLVKVIAHAFMDTI